MIATDKASAATDKQYKKFLFLGLALANAFVLALAALLSWFSYTQSLAHINDVASAFSQNFAHLLELRVERIRSYQNLLAAQMEFELAHPATASSIESLILLLDPESYHIFSARIIDENGKPIYSKDIERTKGANWKDRDYFQTLRDHPDIPFIMSHPLWGKNSQEPTIVFAKPYLKPDKSFGGVVVLSSTLKSLHDLQRPSGSSIDDAFTIRDTRDGALLSHNPYSPQDEAAIGPAASPKQFAPGLAPYLGTYPSEARALIESQAKSGRYTAEQSLDGSRRSIHMIAIDNAPIAVFASLGHNYAHFGNLPAQIGAAIVFFSLFFIISLFLTNQLLAQHVRLRASEAALASLNGTLEAKVAERTADLEDALAKIRQSGAELAASERLAALGDMAAGVAHELNTPIGNALLASSTLSEEARKLREALRPAIGSPSRSALEKHAKRIEELADAQTEAASRSAELVKSFKQVAVDQASLRRRTFDLRESIASLVASLRPSLARSGISLDISLEVPHGIECDSFPGALSQIVANLLQNAAKHAFQGRERGSITISGRAAMDQDGAPKAIVNFADDGAGIPEHVLSKMFQPYFTTASNQGGSGIGLSISRKLCENVLSGTLIAFNAKALSPKKTGAVFKLTFPLSAPHMSAQDSQTLMLGIEKNTSGDDSKSSGALPPILPWPPKPT